MSQGGAFSHRLIFEHDAKRQQQERRRAAERELINAESRLGRTVFGYVSEGYQREFFCLEQNVWIWYEDGVTMRYEVRKDGVYKKVDDGKYFRVEGEELKHFVDATKAYLKLVRENIYH